MEDLSKRSIIDMARGAIKERVDYEMTRVVENILDPNTSATAARKITITLNLKPDDTRQNIAVSCVAKSTLAATNPVTMVVSTIIAVYLMQQAMLDNSELDWGIQVI